MPKYVGCPDAFKELFEKAESQLEPFFGDLKIDASTGAILVNGERYVLYRGNSMAVALRRQMEKVLGASTPAIIYQIGKAVGSADAEFITGLLGATAPDLKLAMGPVAFALGGFARVNILPESMPAPDDSFVLVYEHPNSYEAEAYINDRISVETPVDHLNAGYSAGWCGEAFGMALDAKEITCKAKGDKRCLFVMAPPSKLRERVAEMKKIYQEG